MTSAAQYGLNTVDWQASLNAHNNLRVEEARPRNDTTHSIVEAADVNRIHHQATVSIRQAITKQRSLIARYRVWVIIRPVLQLLNYHLLILDQLDLLSYHCILLFIRHLIKFDFLITSYVLLILVHQNFIFLFGFEAISRHVLVFSNLDETSGNLVALTMTTGVSTS